MVLRWMKMKLYFRTTLIFVAFVESILCLCSSGRHEYYKADDIRRTFKFSNRNSSNHLYNCTFSISPRYYLADGYFLEIKWKKFHIPGYMPYCRSSLRIASVVFEISLSLYSRSIGRFCSNSIDGALPFNIYSIDGYVWFFFFVKEGFLAEFEFSYAMMKTKDYYLESITSCNHTLNTNRTGIIHSATWPNERYYNSSPPLTCRINAGSSKETKIIFMDVDLAKRNTRNYCGENDNDDYLEIRVTDSSTDDFSSSRILKSRICSAQSITTSKKFIFVKFVRNILKPSKHRGFVAGYIVYDPYPFKRRASLVIILLWSSSAAFWGGLCWYCCCWSKCKKAIKKILHSTTEQDPTALTQNAVTNEQPVCQSNSTAQVNSSSQPAGRNNTETTATTYVLNHVTTSVQHQTVNDNSPSYDEALPIEAIGARDNPPPSNDEIIQMEPAGTRDNTETATTTSVLNHVITSVQHRTFLNDCPPSYNDALLMEAVGARDNPPPSYNEILRMEPAGTRDNTETATTTSVLNHVIHSIQGFGHRRTFRNEHPPSYDEIYELEPIRARDIDNETSNTTAAVPIHDPPPSYDEVLGDLR